KENTMHTEHRTQNTDPKELAVIVEYEFHDDGVEGNAAFYGAGTAHTRYDEAVIGCGRSAREAAHDAIEQLATAFRGAFVDFDGAGIACDRRLEDDWAFDVELPAAADELSDSESEIEEFEAECFRE